MVFAPYTDVTLYPPFDFNLVPDLKAVTLGFITASVDNKPCWGGYYDVHSDYYRSIINKAKSNKIDLICSFGGASGKELATVMDEHDLYNAYKKVIETYNFKKLDFDIEGGALGNVKANIRRANVIKKLMENYDLEVSLTLPVSRDGLGIDAVAIAKITPCSIVNIMAMDYGDGQGKMAEYAINAAKSTRGQTGKYIGITTMIGKNDVIGEVFTLDDAKKVAKFARENSWVKRTSFWSLNRDTGKKDSLDKSSQVDQRMWEFSSIFMK